MRPASDSPPADRKPAGRPATRSEDAGRLGSASDAPEAGFELSPGGSMSDEEPSSGVRELCQDSVRCFLCREPEATLMHEGIKLAGLRITVVREVDDFYRLGLSGVSAIDVATKHAAQLISGLAAWPAGFQTIALARDLDEELAAMRAGATVVLRMPTSVELIALTVSRLQRAFARHSVIREETERMTTIAKADAVQHVASSLAHEISNPVTSLCTTLELFQEQVRADRTGSSPDWDYYEEQISTLMAASSRMIRTIEEMRALARGESAPLAPVRLANAVKEALGEVANPRQVLIDVTVASDEVALGREELVVRVIVNLLTNALHAVRDVDAPRVKVRVYQAGGEARVSVRDNGPGVPESIRARIFEPFFTTKGREGSGIGLALSREFVARMGGALTLAAGVQGACFRIRLRPA